MSYNDPKPVGQADSRDRCSGFTGQGLWRQKEVKKSQGVREEFTLTLGYTTLGRPSSSLPRGFGGLSTAPVYVGG